MQPWFFFIIIWSFNVSAAELNPQELVTRCFSALGNIRLSNFDARRAQVQNMDQAYALCDSLIDAPTIAVGTGSGDVNQRVAPVSKDGGTGTQVNATGWVSSSRSNITVDEAREVARQFHDFHRTFFSRDNYEKMFEAERGNTRQIFDPSAPAAYFTSAIFMSGGDYSKAVTEASDLRILRSSGAADQWGNARLEGSSPQNRLRGFDGNSYFNPSENPVANESMFRQYFTIPVDRGDFMGIKREANPVSAWLNSDHLPKYNWNKRGFATYFLNITQPRGSGRISKGGGFIGNSSFLLLNLGATDESYVFDFVTKLPRTWANEVMKVAYCRMPPYLDEGDQFAPDYVEPVGGIPANPPALFKVPRRDGSTFDGGLKFILREIWKRFYQFRRSTDTAIAITIFSALPYRIT